MVGALAASGPRRVRPLPRPARRAGARPALDHRPRDRAAADVQRARHDLGGVQRRDLQPRRAARRADSPRTSLPDAQRHRGDRPRLRRSGVRAHSCASTASSPWRCGTSRQKRWCWRATDWVSGRSICASTRGRLWFASEVKAIFAGDRSIPRAFDPIGLAETFTFWSTTAPQIRVRGSERARAGPRPDHHARLGRLTGRSGSRATRSTGQTRFHGDPRRGGGAGAHDARRGRSTADAARRRARRELPLGWARQLACRGARTPRERDRFCTYSIRFEDAEYDETPFQRTMARLIESDHREIMVRGADIADVFPDVVASRGATRSCGPHPHRSSCCRGWSANPASRWC